MRFWQLHIKKCQRAHALAFDYFMLTIACAITLQFSELGSGLR
jgi:hypothetical protein